MSELCPDCGATFADPADLVRHLAESHNGGDSRASMAMNPYSETSGFTCGLCGASFATPRELAAHGLRPHLKTGQWGGSASARRANPT